MASRFYPKIQSFIRGAIYLTKLVVLWIQYRWWALAGLSVLALILWGSAFYFLGYTALKQQVRVTYDATFLPSSNNNSSDAWEIFSQLNMISTQIKLLEQTISNLNGTLEEKEKTISKLKEQLYFYRAIVAPEDHKEGLSIFSAKLGRPYQGGGFPWEIILRQHGKGDITRKGHIKITISNGDGSRARRLTMQRFYKGDTQFSFRYFQRLQGVISLPKEFLPVKVSVRVLSSGQQAIEEAWYWGDLLGGNHAHK